MPYEKFTFYPEIIYLYLYRFSYLHNGLIFIVIE